MNTIKPFFGAMALLAAAGSAWGQQPYSPSSRQPYSPYSRPTLSPYLNLLRGGNPAANYYLGVVPERERRADEIQTNRELQDLERRTQSIPYSSELDDVLPTLPSTGHPTGFMTLNPYFTSSPVLGGLSINSSTGYGSAPSRRGR